MSLSMLVYENEIDQLETKVQKMEAEGKFAPTIDYETILLYYYENLQNCRNLDSRIWEIEARRVGKWYGKALKAGCNPNDLEGRFYYEEYILSGKDAPKGTTDSMTLIDKILSFFNS